MQGTAISKEVKLTPDEIEREYELERQVAIDRARVGILNFTTYTKPDYQVNWHHRKLGQVLNGVIRKEKKRVIITMPPRHGKSEQVSTRLPAMILGIDPDAKIIAASHTAELAGAVNRNVQRVIDSPEYRELFPETTLTGKTTRTDDETTYARNSQVFEIVGHAGAYRCAGVGGPLAGHGGDFLILDDPIKNQEEADSPVYREKLWEWYVSVFSTRAHADACIIIVLTRWHEDDIAGRLLAKAKEDPEADQWVVISFPAIKEALEIPGDPRSEGEALWPERYPIEVLKTKRATGGTRIFNSVYQQRPSSEEGDIVKREWTRQRYKVLPDLGEKKKWDQFIISADLRFKDDKKSGDYVVYQAWARKGSAIYFLDEDRGRWGFTECLDHFQAFCAKHKGARLKLVENKANGPALENVLKKRIMGIVLEEPEGSKTARVNSVTPLWEAGNVWLPDDSIYPGIGAIVEEWVSFGPGCAFDDRTDTMSQALKRFQSEIGSGLADFVRW